MEEPNTWPRPWLSILNILVSPLASHNVTTEHLYSSIDWISWEMQALARSLIKIANLWCRWDTGTAWLLMYSVHTSEHVHIAIKWCPAKNISEKGTISCYSRIFILNTYISGTIAAMNVNFGMNIYSSIILLHLQGIPSPTHFHLGRGDCTRWSHLKIAVLCLTLVAHCSGQQACSSF